MLNWIVWNEVLIIIKMNLALNNLQSLLCHKTNTNKYTLNATVKSQKYNLVSDLTKRFFIRKV